MEPRYERNIPSVSEEEQELLAHKRVIVFGCGGLGGYVLEYLARMGVEVFPASVYGLAAIPHRIIVSDIFWVVGSVFVFGLLASLIPSLAAASKDPVKALHQ